MAILRNFWCWNHHVEIVRLDSKAWALFQSIGRNMIMNKLHGLPSLDRVRSFSSLSLCTPSPYLAGISMYTDLILIICTGGKFQRILLHVGRTSSEKSAINAILGGFTPVARPIFARLRQGFHFEDCLIPRFYFVSDLVGKDFPTKEHLTQIRTFVKINFTVSFPKRIK